MSAGGASPLIVPHSRVVVEQAAIDAVEVILRSGQVSTGMEVQRLEEALGAFLGGREVVAVSSGTAALHLVLEALRRSNQDRVVLPSYTCVSLYNAALMARMRPTIVDIEEHTGNISPDQVRSALRSNVRAVVVPHMFGCLAKVDELKDIGVPVIEDCAHAIGAVQGCRPAGALSDVSVFSFYATKMLHGVQGGAVACGSKELAEELRDLRDYAGEKRKWRLRYNYKLSDVHAAIVLVHLRRLTEYVQRRKELAQRYNSLLTGLPGVRLPDASSSGDHVYYRYVIRLTEPHKVSKVRARMRAMGVGTGVGVLRAIHEEVGLPDEEYPNTSLWRRTALSLPIYPTLREEEQDLVVHALLKALEKDSHSPCRVYVPAPSVSQLDIGQGI